MNRPMLFRSLASAGLALALGGCTTPDLAPQCPIPVCVNPSNPNAPCTAAQEQANMQQALQDCYARMADVPVDTRLHKPIDILFVIDNSPSMSPKQMALAAAIPQFIKIIDGTGSSYHVGVTTSDIGTTVAPGQTFPIYKMNPGTNACDSFFGDDGKLQKTPCSQRALVTPDATMACSMLCQDPKFVPTDGNYFIAKDDMGITNVPKLLMPDPMNPGQMIDVGPQKTFQCIGLTGDIGCGVEGQLDGMWRALNVGYHKNRPENNNFLRDGSVLAVIFITDEDDCSVSQQYRAMNDPAARDCTDAQAADPNNGWQCYNVDFRCIARDLQCSQPMSSPTTGMSNAKTGCSERPDNTNTSPSAGGTPLEPISKYANLLTGLRPSNQLVVAGIWTLPSIFTTGNFNTAQLNIGGSTGSAGINRAIGANAGCVNAMDMKLFGQPQLRLSKFLKALPADVTSEISVCDTANYTTALTNIAMKITNRLIASCLLVNPKIVSGQPDCVVGDVPANTPMASLGPTDPLLPLCGKSCCAAWAASAKPTSMDPNIVTACMPEPADCFCALPSTATPNPCPFTAVAGVWRKGGAASPSGKVTDFKCYGTPPPM